MFEPEPGLMIWTVVSFVLLLLLLKKFAYKPILELMEGREKAIRDEIETSEQLRRDAETLLSQYKAQLDEGRNEVQKMIEEGRSVGEKLKKEIMAKADEESKALVRKAQEEIEKEKERALMALQEHVAGLSVKIASRMIETTLSPDDHGRLIEGALAQAKEEYGKN